MQLRIKTSEGDRTEVVRKSSNFLEDFKRKHKLTTADLVVLGVLLWGIVYSAIVEPFITCLFLLAVLVFYCLNQIFQLIPPLEKWSGIKIHLWHGVLVTVAAIALLSAVELPSQALFLSGLEQYITDTVEATGNTDIEEGVIEAIFAAIRAIFLILAGVAGLYAYNMSQQGNDWRPIAGTVGMAFGIIFAIDVITFAFVGA